MAITRLDILDGFSTIRICTGYTLDGVANDRFPSRIGDLARCRPVYEEMPGWQASTGEAREYDQLPPEARRYLERLEELVGCPVQVISVGSSREQTVHKAPIV
jgi:adenylosuccinate synthase